MVLVFLDWFLMVYKPVNARGAHNLNIFPCFVVNILEMNRKQKQWLTATTKMQTSTGIEILTIQEWYTSKNAISAQRKVATVGAFDWILVPFCV